MTIETTARAALTAILAQETGLGVTVSTATETASGMRVMVNKQIESSMLGISGQTDYTVRVSDQDLAEPDRGTSLFVDGKQCWVLGCRTSGGLRVIEVTETKPVEGV